MLYMRMQQEGKSQERFRIKIIETSLRNLLILQWNNNVLFKSKKILYQNFNFKFNEIMRKLGIEERNNAKIEYDQYLIAIKYLIYLDLEEESKISENKEIYDGWKIMMGNIKGYVTKQTLNAFLWNALELKPNKIEKNNNCTPSNKSSSKNFNQKDSDKSSVHISNIDLLKADEEEIRLDSIDNTVNPLTKIQQIYRDIKGEPTDYQIMPIK